MECGTPALMLPRDKGNVGVRRKGFGGYKLSPREQEKCSHLPHLKDAESTPVTSHWLTAFPMVTLEGQEKAIWFGIQS